MPSVCVLKTHRLYHIKNVRMRHRGSHKCTARQAKQQPIVCSACKPVTTLPNGLTVCYASKYDVSFLYREIFEEQLYLQHGIRLEQGDTVVDVGGNIGFFALFAAQQVGPTGQVVSAEPIPTLHEKLVYNIESHQKWCAAQGVPTASITPILAGVGSGQQQTMEFTFYTAAAGWSTMYPDNEEVQGAMQVFLEQSLSGLQGIDSSLLTSAGQLLQSTAPKWVTRPIERLFVQNMLRQQEKHVCSMTTISEIMQRHGLQHISLLKIDVERAELDVLSGVSLSDWQRISQLVMEVHDVQDRLQQITKLLKHDAGFTSVKVTQDEQLKGSTIYNIYCYRQQEPLNRSNTTESTKIVTASC